MANHAKNSLLCPSFFTIILPHFHENGVLEFPEHFVKEHWKSFSKHACLEVPTGEKSKMKLNMSNGRAWLHKGWKDFVQKYSIKYGYLLVFRHQERSNFIVQIFDLSTGQIKYPISCYQKEVDFDIKEEQCDDEDCPTELDKDSEMEMEVDNHSSKSKSGRKALRSRNAHFTITMKPAYVTDGSRRTFHMHIPKYARSYFHNKKNDDIYLSLEGENGKVWSMKYYVGNPSIDITRISSGWRDFSEENNLKEGDICTFERLSSKDMIFKVAISQKNNKKRKKGHTGMSDVSPRGTKKPAKHVKCNETAFAITISKTDVEDKCRLSIPRAHSARHLVDQHGKEVFLHRLDGKIWRAKCYNLGVLSRFNNGWKSFLVDNDLQVGDTCVFELITEKPNHYKVAMFSGAGSSG